MRCIHRVQKEKTGPLRSVIDLQQLGLIENLGDKHEQNLLQMNIYVYEMLENPCKETLQMDKRLSRCRDCASSAEHFSRREPTTMATERNVSKSACHANDMRVQIDRV